MDAQPDYTDAAILIALVWGGSPERVLGATDHINAGYAGYDDWVHACTVLGQLGLLEASDPLPLPTASGELMVARHTAGTPPRVAASALSDALSELPIAARPVPPPERRVIEQAITDHREHFWG